METLSPAGFFYAELVLLAAPKKSRSMEVRMNKNYEFDKYSGLGNDYLVFDPNKNDDELTIEQIKNICDRNFGIGSDGILVGPVYEEGKTKVRIFNPDGSEAEKSGNGLRIFAKYLKDAGYQIEPKFTISTIGGDVGIEYINKNATLIQVSMGKLSFKAGDIGINTQELPISENDEWINQPLKFGDNEYSTTCVSIGNPHCVIQMNEVTKEIACEIGKYSENATYFKDRINTQIAWVVDRKNVQIEIYERGAGYTLASGSSSCAAAGALYRQGLIDSAVTVHMPGGSLQIQILPDMEVLMTGRVSSIGKIMLSPKFFEELS